MTNSSTLPRSINTLRSNVTETVDEDPSPNGTIYYSADSEQENRRRGVTTKRPIREEGDEDETQDISAFMLRRKQSKLEDPEDTPVLAKADTPPSRPTATNSVRPTTSNKTQTFEYEVEEPDWTDRPHCWAFLQSCNKDLENKYLEIRDKSEDNRSGYCIGRSDDNDIKYNLPFVSKTHCLLYMETGASGEQKGIRIYVEDRSTNGTFVNGTKLGCGVRKLLKGGDKIQLKYNKNRPDDHPANRYYRICFPPVFDAKRCVEAFSFREVLGRGNFATVYRATSNETGEEVAIKLMNKSRFENKPKSLKSVIGEMGIMMSLEKHPFVVQMKRIFNEDKNIYLVLEYVKDGELFSYIRDRQKLTEDETRFVFWQLFNAIKYLHDSNVAHRDLKPENVIMADKAILHIKVSDFGLAKTIERNTTFDSQCGTPNYVAPEVLSNVEDRAYGKECDMWSLGVMLYICLCGYPPFSEENGPPSMKEQIKNAKFEFLSPYWNGISTEAKDLIKKLLTVNPDDRLTSVEALEHEWMKMNPKDMEHRQSKLPEDALQLVEERSTNQPVTLTQACTQTSQLGASY